MTYVINALVPSYALPKEALTMEDLRGALDCHGATIIWHSLVGARYESRRTTYDLLGLPVSELGAVLAALAALGFDPTEFEIGCPQKVG